MTLDTRSGRFHVAAFIAAAFALLSACGGGGDDSPPSPLVTTTNVTTTAIDGVLRNALVCLDKNVNGKCELDEVQGRTDAAGSVTLAVPNDDVGKFPLLALVGPESFDDGVAVTVPYAMSTPADQTGVVSPLTTLVQRAVATTGGTSAEAAQSLRDSTGITASLFADYTKAAAPTDGSTSAAAMARLLVLTTQQQQTAIVSTVGTTAIDGGTIAQTDLDKAIQHRLLDLLPDLVAALGSPAVLAATTPAEREAALQTQAVAVAQAGGLTAAAAAVAVGINNQASVTQPAATPSAGVQLNDLSFTDASNYYARLLTSSLAQNTPDANSTTRYVDRRARSNGGNVAKWGSGSDPARNADLNWNGSAWVGCPINYENVSGVRDALGKSTYSYCDQRETGRTNRSTFDVGGKTMAEVYAQIVAGGYTNLFIANPSLVGTASFPAGAAIYYQTNTPLTAAFAYYPGGARNAPGFSNVVSQYTAAVSSGGDAATQGAGAGCNSTETTGNGSHTTTLEGMIASKGGTPCIFGPGSFVYGGVTYSSGPSNIWWGNSTVSLGKLGTAPVNSGTAPGFYTGNTHLRVAFKGTGANPVTYFACQERFNNGSPRNCAPIGTGSYTIQALGDGRAMSFNNAPVQAAALNYNRVFVERGGLVYLGYQSKTLTRKNVRMNTTASAALLAQLGVAAEDPSVPMALTAGSYQGTWDVRTAGDPINAATGTTLSVNANGSVTCFDRASNMSQSCTLTITDPATGAFTYASGPATASGSFNFLAGTVGGTYSDPTSSPVNGTFSGGRR